jgi:hypothetical protein
MFGLDTKSLVIGAALGMLVIPRVVSFATAKLGGSK